MYLLKKPLDPARKSLSAAVMLFPFSIIIVVIIIIIVSAIVFIVAHKAT
jgi:hypothetical protein